MRMHTQLRSGALRTYGLPLLILAPATLGIFWFDGPGALVLFAVSFALGLILRPPHLWVIWLGAIILWWLAGGVWSLWGEGINEAESGETFWSFMFETIPFTAMLVLLPMFLGRLTWHVSNKLINGVNHSQP